MKSTAEQDKAARFIRELIKACWTNKEFKTKFIADPIETIEKVTGKKSQLPKGVRIEVEDQSDTSFIYLNIPASPK